jgi:predicted HAD superfamily Cof-like phosphohydrolase
MSPYDMVLEFHKTYGVPVGVEPTLELLELRSKLHTEELIEIEDELFPDGLFIEDCPKDIVKSKLTKELADLMYVVIGTAVTFGLPLEEVFAEVHRSNMSKLGADGKPIYREDGKVLKGPNYFEPDLEGLF